MDHSYLLLLFFLLSSISAAVPVDSHPNKVVDLPGAPRLPEFNLFSGYLDGNNRTLAPIFYVLAEAIRVDPSTAPLVVWFNGGPGASSLTAFFKEHGPYRITESGDTLTYNEFSWNQYCNVLYLESPLGVGFSQSSEGNITLNDYDAAEINLNALIDFMTRVHPNYADRDYYLTGQSYGGVFVPYLARRILKGIEAQEMENANFKGFTIGNPVFESISMFLANLVSFYSYGLMPLSVSERVMIAWTNHLEGGKYRRDDELEKIDYDIFTRFITNNGYMHYNYIDHCFTENLHEEYHVPTDKKSIACYGTDSLENYMNREDVQLSLHVGNISVERKNWTIINKNIAHTFTRVTNVSSIYKDIFTLTNGSSFRVLFYNGDTDIMVTSIHTIHNTALIAKANSMEDLGTNAWKFFGDFAGVHTRYRNGNVTMDVLIVRGAGHSVPTDLPAQSFQMINNLFFTEDDQDIDYSRPIRKH